MSEVRWVDCPVVIPYYGGKFELSRKLVPRLPAHDRYIEMFAGGLSMFFRKKKVDWNIINDKDKNVVNLYMVIAEHFDEFCDTIKWYVKSRVQHQLLKEYIKDSEIKNLPDVKRAARYYYLVKCSFNNNPQGTFSKNSTDWKPEQFAKSLMQSRKYLDGVVVENLDFKTLVEKYSPKKEDLWYLDPPYVVTANRKDYYIHVFSEKDHEDLKDICDYINTSGGKFMLSYDDKEIVHELYKDYKIDKIPVIYAGQRDRSINKVKNEIVITNYDPQGVQVNLFDNIDGGTL